ncbi:MAG TPA: phosphoglucosamine mutase [Candidatus Woesearchaeota archaeon]|nr:phosphoglucosamine mutase [Candidatus Woesearchaeota archaeon]
MKLFGTDGIRANSKSEVLNEQSVLRIGYSIASWAKDIGCKSVIIGKDTRESSERIERWLLNALESNGIEAILTGIIPTPVVSYLCKKLGYFGIMITASHNPYYDNGIKLFYKNGRKTKELEERLIEDYYEKFKHVKFQTLASFNYEKLVRKRIKNDLISLYNSDFESIRNFYLEKKVVLDCANGAGYFIGKDILEKCVKCLKVVNFRPDGKNINYNCGAMHPNILSKQVVLEKADLGIAFDGDADRVVFCDEKGEIIDGDHYIGFIARHTNQKEIVYTDYSNLSLDNFLKENNLKGIRVENGDKFVSEELGKRNLFFGGEKSGHYIFKEYNESGDGILSAIRLLKILYNEKMPLSKIREFELFPQVIVSEDVDRKKDLNEIDGLNKILEYVEKMLGEDSRTNIRYSGTEMKIRVLVEGKSQEKCSEFANKIAGFIKDANKSN